MTIVAEYATLAPEKSQNLRQFSRFVALYATFGSERTRENDDRTQGIDDRTRRFDERTRATANEPEALQPIDINKDFAVRHGLAAGRATRELKIAERTGAALAVGAGS